MTMIRQAIQNLFRRDDNYLDKKLEVPETYTEKFINPYAFGADVIDLELANAIGANTMSIPAVWAAIDFLAGNLAALPLKVYNKETKN